LAAGLLALASTAGAQFTAATGSPFSAGSNTSPVAVAVGDFNRDGVPDLATANSTGNSVTVLLGNGTGGFIPAPGSPFAVGPDPESLVVRDFNGDGNPDLAVANTSGNTVTVLLGDGTGRFSPASGSPFFVGFGPVFITAGDFNGDGKPDLAVANTHGSSNVTVLLGNGAGAFTQVPGSPFPVGTTPLWLVVGDFNGDGKPDLVSLNRDSRSLSLLLGNGAGGFTAAAGSPIALPGFEPESMAGADFNGDGNLDIAVANNGGNNVTVLLGNGSGGFTQASGSPFAVGVSPFSLMVADFNGDGIPDLATADNIGQDVSLLLGNGAGGFAPAVGSPIATGSYPAALVVADFNGDGRPDIAVANEEMNNVSVFLNTYPMIGANPASLTFYAGAGQAAPAGIPVAVSSPTSGSAYSATSNQAWLTPSPASNATGGVSSITVSANPASLAAGAYSGVVRYTAPGFFDAKTQVTLNIANPSGTLAAAAGSPFAVGASPNSVAVADFNGDGIPDLAVVNTGSNNVTLLLGNGSGGFTAASGGPFAVAPAPASVAAGDFNGDGKPDLVTASTGTPGIVSILIGKGDGTFQPAVTYPMLPGLALGPAIAVADFNGDGKADLATANINSAHVAVLLGNGDGTFGSAVGYLAANTSTSLALADFNGDGKLDIATGNAGSISLLRGNGNGTFQAALVYQNAGPQGQTIATGDFNGDGKPDLVSANSFGDNVSVLLGNGDGTFQSAATYAAGTEPRWVVVADFNGDGRLDLAVANEGDNDVTLLLGNGAGGFTAATGAPFTVGNGPVYVAAGDFNGDGRPDLVAVNYADNDITVLLGASAATRSILSTTAGSPLAYGQPVPLTLVVSDSVTAFNAPTATVTFFDGATTLGVASQTSGPFTFTASGLGVGSHNLTATYSGDTRNSGSASNIVTIQVTQASQTIAFAPLANLALATGTFTIGATSTSGLAVGFASQTLSVCTVSGTTVTLISIGVCTIQGTQAGNANYLGAAPVNGSFNVTPASQTITFAALPNQVFGAVPFTVGATASSGLPVSFASATTTVCVVSGTTVTLIAAGTCTIQATQPGNATYATATVVNNSFAVSPLGQTITFLPLANEALGVNPFTVSATASSGFAVTVVSLTTSVCTVSGITITLVSAGTCTIQASQPGNAGYLAAPNVTQSFAVTVKPSEVGIFRQNFAWLLDANGNRTYDGTGPGLDYFYFNFVPAQSGDIPVVGDWSGSGTTKIGIYRPATGQWFLDYNGDGVFDAGDKTYNFGGIAGDKPVVGDWSGSGTSKIGIFRSGYFWLLDYNGDGSFDNGDQAFAFGGVAGDVPVAGDWTGDGKAKVGVVRVFVPGGTPAFWILDANNDHTINAGDLVFAFGGIPGDVAVVGDWNGTGFAKAGMFRQGFFWVVDNNGSAPTVLGGNQVVAFGYGGVAGDIPVVGKW